MWWLWRVASVIKKKCWREKKTSNKEYRLPSLGESFDEKNLSLPRQNPLRFDFGFDYMEREKRSCRWPIREKTFFVQFFFMIWCHNSLIHLYAFKYILKCVCFSADSWRAIFLHALGIPLSSAFARTLVSILIRIHCSGFFFQVLRFTLYDWIRIPMAQVNNACTWSLKQTHSTLERVLIFFFVAYLWFDAFITSPIESVVYN